MRIVNKFFLRGMHHEVIIYMFDQEVLPYLLEGMTTALNNEKIAFFRFLCDEKLEIAEL
jgi:hypothetical protein